MPRCRRCAADRLRLATATDVGSLDATPITSDSGSPSFVIRPRLSSRHRGARRGCLRRLDGQQFVTTVAQQLQRSTLAERGRRGRCVPGVGRRAHLRLRQRHRVVAARPDRSEQVNVEQTQSAHLGIGEPGLLRSQRQLHNPRVTILAVRTSGMADSCANAAAPPCTWAT